MNFRPLGADGAQSRMREIQARLDGVLGRKDTPPPPAPTPPLPAEMPGGLSGSIGGPGGFKPMNPLGPGMHRTVSPAPEHLKGLIEQSANAAGVDPHLFESLVAAESSFNPGSTSKAGAMGLSQLMPGTARALGVRDPFDPEQNLRAGAKYLAQMMSRFGGDPKLALAAYNAGPGAVERHGGIPPYRETRAYVERVMNRFEATKNP